MSKRKKLFSVSRITDPRFPGLTARVCELERGGNLFLVRMVEGKQQMRSLRRTRTDLGGSREEQERAARAIGLDAIAVWAQGGSLEAAGNEDAGPINLAEGDLTLGQLADLYGVHGLHGRSESYRKSQPRKVRRVAEFLGPERLCRSLCESDCDRFAAHLKSKGRSQGTIYQNLLAMKIALRWAARHRDAEGNRLLESSPLADVSLRSERNPMRPVATEERYLALKKVAGQVPDGFGLALDLAWHTGHRIGAILSLTWDDIDFTESEEAPHGQIHWAAQNDKTGYGHTVPINSQARKALERERELRPGIGRSLLFPAPTDPTKPSTPSRAYSWLVKAEALSGLEHLEFGGWHQFRRAWASRRRHLPLVDVARAGGWRRTQTVVESYAQPDAAGILSVVNGA